MDGCVERYINAWKDAWVGMCVKERKGEREEARNGNILRQ
jgi:hypothetical protein